MSDDLPRDEEVVGQPGPDDLRLWSVTTIIDQSSSNRGLIEWAAGETAAAAVHSQEFLKAMILHEGEDEAIAWLKDARNRARKGERTAKQLGADIHHACETYAITGQKPPVDDEVAPYLDQFDNWCQAFQPAYEAAEMTVYSPTYGYAGTLDAILRVDGARVVTDYKSSKKDRNDKGERRTPWPDVALQLSAYRYAEFAGPWRTRRYTYFRRRYYLLGQAERADAVPIPEVDGGLCLYLTPQRCDAYPVVCGPEVHEAFLYAVERAHWSLEQQGGVIGDAIRAPAKVRA
jgi:hypothetical protein